MNDFFICTAEKRTLIHDVEKLVEEAKEVVSSSMRVYLD